jgi:hypothetical protein
MAGDGGEEVESVSRRMSSVIARGARVHYNVFFRLFVLLFVNFKASL